MTTWPRPTGVDDYDYAFALLDELADTLKRLHLELERSMLPVMIRETRAVLHGHERQAFGASAIARTHSGRGCRAFRSLAEHVDARRAQSHAPELDPADRYLAERLVRILAHHLHHPR